MTVQAMRLAGHERVLEIGTGSGYAAAILGKLAREVYTVERIPELAQSAEDRLARLGFTNVHVRCGDGTLGWLEHAPYEAIAVAAGAPSPPRSLLAQLTIGGRLVVPHGTASSQQLVRITRKSETEFSEEDLGDVRFVPLIGVEGWAEYN
jgi:protein-L-isoaspartate(D-aspartate) O-methyltransferase